MNGIGTQTIETNRVILRRFQVDDYKKVYLNWASDSNTTKFLNWDTHENDDITKLYIESKMELYEKEFFFDWVVVRKEDNEPIGEISCVKFSKAHDGYYWEFAWGPNFKYDSNGMLDFNT